MDIKGLINKGKDALSKNTKVIDQGADAVNKATKGKYASQVRKGADAARKFAQDGNKNPDQPK
ncbi:antitoxin [Nocardia sp. 348MFTsu5.1]|uniref:antitoxin n=1 Tax=Nocardia sp. 348MFTsu5.1 TaxID=1172185 RepID=UPI00036893CC|nr:antitoxin [Nocardia sp. 348MFTsu5.1]